MHKFLVLSTLFILGFSSPIFAQSTPEKANVIPAGSHKYYMYISGVAQRSDVEHLEKSISKKPGVKYFTANRFPVRYFMLISDEVISEAQFASWLNPQLYKIEVYGETEKHYMTAIEKSKQKQN